MEEIVKCISHASSAAESLRNWFLRNKRDLPWRKNKSPYSVWISEIMLQQTRVDTVIDYFNRWMERYPTLQDVVESSDQELMKIWEGLGYYSRVRSFKKGAEMVIERFHGQIPSTYDDLIQIPGIGPYTANAILAFAFNKRVAAVDGNILRVFSRLLCIKDSIDSASVRAAIQSIANDFLPFHNPCEVAEALIELGACICNKSPQCHNCPLRSHCQAFQFQEMLRLPIRSARKRITQLFRCVFLVRCRDKYCLVRRGEGEIMKGLFEFPYCSIADSTSSADREAMIEACQEMVQAKVSFVKKLPAVQHTFTHYKAWLYPILFESSSYSTLFEHYSLQEIAALPLSSGHKKILQQLLSVHDE